MQVKAGDGRMVSDLLSCQRQNGDGELMSLPIGWTRIIVSDGVVCELRRNCVEKLGLCVV